jgi:hypothetical protein
MRRTLLKPMLIAAAILALFAGGGSGAPSAPDRAGAQEVVPLDLVFFGPQTRLKVGKTLKYTVGCSAQCDLVTSHILHFPGRDLGPLTVDPQPMAKNQSIVVYLRINKAAKSILSKNRGKARLKAEITAKNLETGSEIVVNRTFRFQVASRS